MPQSFDVTHIYAKNVFVTLIHATYGAKKMYVKHLYFLTIINSIFNSLNFRSVPDNPSNLITNPGVVSIFVRRLSFTIGKAIPAKRCFDIETRTISLSMG